MGCNPCFHQASAEEEDEEELDPAVPEWESKLSVELCDSCISITHDSVISGAIFYFDADPASSTNKCSLCGVVRGAYLEYPGTRPYWIYRRPPKAKQEETTPRRQIKLEVSEVTSASPDESCCDLMIARVTLQDTWYADEVRREFYFHSNHSRGSCGLKRHPLADPVPNDTVYGALSPWADLRLARAWIRECHTQHADCQPIIPATSVKLHPSTKFIDAKVRRLVVLTEIVDAPVEFVALSYVWGTAYQLRTTSTKIDRFRERLPSTVVYDDDDRIPKTVEDAMEVTLALGYRYLWVDALCIIQDSPEDLKIQLLQLHHIYSIAAVTIVARSSRSLDSGLSGVSIPRDWLGDVDSSGHILSNIGYELLRLRTPHPHQNADQGPAVKLPYNPAPPGMYPSWSWLSQWPLEWPFRHKPFVGTDVQLRDTDGVSVLEIRGPSLEMSVGDRGGTDKKETAVLWYGDGTDSRLEVRLDQPLET